MHWTDKIIQYLTPEKTQQLLLFGISTIIITVVHLHFKKEWTTGLKGENKLWEGPEILLYLCTWIFGPLLFADVFLQQRLSDMGWYTYWICLLIGVFGKWGLEWILAFKTGQSSVKQEVTITSKTTEQQTTKTEE